MRRELAALALLLAGACATPPLPFPLPGGVPDAPAAETATGRLEIRAGDNSPVTVTQGLGGESASAVDIEAAYQRGFDQGRDSARPGAAWPGADEAQDPDAAAHGCDCQDEIDRAFGDGYDAGHREARGLPPLERDCSSGKCVVP